MCRALKVLCAAAGPERLQALKRAAVSADWELIRGASSIDELVRQAEETNPDVVVIHDSLGEDAGARVRGRVVAARIVTVGDLDSVREAILGAPPPGGPVRS